jgi:hypothetical protein
MAFVEAWVETDPDGSVITGSLLDDYQRQAKRALRERLEGDAANPLSGIFEVGTFSATAIVKAGSARLYAGTDAAIQALGAAYKQDGRMAIATDTNQLYHLRPAMAPVKIGISASGPNTVTAASSRDPQFLLRDSAATALAANVLFGTNGMQMVVQAHDSNARFAAVGYAAPAQFLGYRANGTSALPTQAINGSILASFGGRGYTSAPAWTNASAAGMDITATEAWTGAANGAQVSFYVTATGGTATTTALTLGQNAQATFAGDVIIPATKGFFPDGGGDTKIVESSPNNLHLCCRRR